MASTLVLEPIRKASPSDEGDLQQSIQSARGATPRAKSSGTPRVAPAPGKPPAPAEAFSAYQDHSKLNGKRHQAARSDTFNTPSRLQKDAPTRSDKKWGLVGDMPFNDLLWICEQSFRKESVSLGKEILGLARREFQTVTETIFTEIKEPVEALAEQIVDKINQILHEVEGTAKVDFTPVHKDLEVQEAHLHQIDDALAAKVAQILDNLHEVQMQQERTGKELLSQIGEVRKDMDGVKSEVRQRSDRQASQVSNLEQTLKCDHELLSSSVDELKHEVKSGRAELLPTLEAQFKKFTIDNPVNVDLSKVTMQLQKSQALADSSFRQMMQELGQTSHNITAEIAAIGDHQTDLRGQLNQVLDTGKKKVLDPSNARHIACQTDAPDRVDHSAQTDGKIIIPKKMNNIEKDSKSKSGANEGEEKEKDKTVKPMFADAEAMKQKARAALMKPQYAVTDFYYETGLFQSIAKSWIFENFTFFVIFINAIWIAIDIDNNEAAVLLNADPVFQVVENIFCFYFTCELLIRLFAFKRKRNCFRDMWFVFDTILVSLMVCETWVLTIVLVAAGGGGGVELGNTQLLRMIRMVKMVRLTRMARLLRAIPELVVVIKAVGAAARSIQIFMLLWLIVIYIFAVLFRQASEGELQHKYFDSVTGAMNSLLLDGILPTNANLVNDVSNANPIFFPVIMFFILLTSVTLMYMLVGVLVEVIAVVAATEKEGMVVTIVASRLRSVMRNMDRDESQPLSKFEFQELMVDPDVASILQEVGVNVVVLLDMSDVIFEQIDKEGKGMTFETLIELVLNMRGSNPATVKDVKEQLRVIKGMLQDTSNALLGKFSREFQMLNGQMKALRNTLDPEEDSQNGEANEG